MYVSQLVSRGECKSGRVAASCVYHSTANAGRAALQRNWPKAACGGVEMQTKWRSATTSACMLVFLKFYLSHASAPPNQCATGSWSNSGARCPSGWGESGVAGCLMNNGDDSRSWSGARDRCVALGGYLAFPTSSSEYDAINQYRLNTDGVGGDGHDTWGGIYQSDGVWYNVLGNRQHYFRWDNNEPSGGEYCVQFRDSEDMNDEDCPRDFRFVCQRAWSCSSCPPGKFSDGTFACTSCPAGNHSADAGASTCTACAAGMFSAGGASQCSACAAGTFSAAGAGSCVSCLPGAFSPSNGSSSCSPCPLPNSSSPAGSATCLCDAGFAGDGVTTCQPCSAGSFSTAGAANCSHCPRGSWSPAGSVSVLNCSCNAGFYNDVAAVELARSQCPNGWTSAHERCVRLFEGPADWPTARQNCVDLGGDLAYPRSQSDNGALRTILGGGNAWISANDRETEGLWRTAQGQTLPYTSWIGGEPNNGLGTGGEDCGQFWYDGRLNDRPCSDQLRYLCEKVQNMDIVVCSACDPGKYSNTSAATQCTDCPAGKYTNESGSISCAACPPDSSSATGSATCLWDHLFLAVFSMLFLSFAAHRPLVWAVFHRSKTGDWPRKFAIVALASLVGMSVLGETHATLQCAHANNLIASCDYNGCANVPCRDSGHIRCNNGVWDAGCGWLDYNPVPDGYCHHGDGYCPDPSPCGPGNYSANGLDYMGDGACKPCPLPNSSSPPGSATCLCDAGFAGDGVTTCQPCSAGSFSTAGAANCSHCPRGSWSPAGSVSVLNCSCNAGFYNDVAAVELARSQCPNGWTSAHERCVRLFEGPADWPTARQNCVDLGGDLAYPRSQSDNGALRTILGGGNAWISANDRETEGLWRTAQGQTLPYTSWIGGEPNNGLGTGGEDCGQFWYDGRLNDRPCSDQLRYLCEKVQNMDIVVCSACDPGKYSNTSAATQCTDCPAGKFINESGSISCVACPPDSSSAAGSATCLCDAGFAGDGVKTCQPCSAGSFSAAGAANCSECPSDSWSPAGSASVLNCSCNAGFYNDVAGNSGPVGGGACQACAAGSFKSWLGGGLCTNCSASTYASSPGATFCTTCATGTYASSPGATSCMPCPSGTVGTSLVGSTSASGCVVSCNAAPATKTLVTCLRAYACVSACIHGHNT